MEYKNTLYGLAAAGGLALYLQFINKKAPWVNPIPTGPDSILNPDADPPILIPEPGQIEDIWNNKTTPTVDPAPPPTDPVIPTYPGSEWADAYTWGTDPGIQPVTPAPTPAPVVDIGDFNPNNPYDPSGFLPGVYAGGYADSYAAYG